jgi:heptosyltransferase-2
MRQALIQILLSPRVLRLVMGPPLMLRRGWMRLGFARGAPGNFEKTQGVANSPRVLVVRLDRIGDVVLTTPFLRELRAALPGSWITLVVVPQLLPLMQACPYVNQVLGYQRTRPFGGGKADLNARLDMIRFAMRELWPGRFDLAINPRRGVDFEFGTMLCHLSGARRRIGFTEQPPVPNSPSNNGFNQLLTDVLPTARVHEVVSNLSVLKSLGHSPAPCDTVPTHRLELWADPADQEWARRKLQIVPGRDRFVCFCIGASQPLKQWSIGRFSEVGAHLLNRTNDRIVIVGGPGDSAPAEQLVQQLGDRVINLAGKATLRQTFAVLQLCRLYVGNDTGPMHLAAAAGVAVVEICSFPRSLPEWNSNSPARFAPWGVPSIVLQPERPTAPCVDFCVAPQPHCILGVQTTDVISAVDRIENMTGRG